MDILTALFPRVLPLADYLAFTTDEDRALVAALLVAPAKHADAVLDCSQHSQQDFSQPEIVNRAIEFIVKRPDPQKNIIAQGFKLLKSHSTSVNGMHGVENPVPNTIVSLLKSPQWQKILDR
ncbi:hypothetical protein HDU98_008579 [Podochytrium sp. JEL0797]|nr:hypothetical protein HDU98_008579 [Podochytrium sp. JEL0797]